MILHTPTPGAVVLGLSRHLPLRCYEPARAEQPHQDLWHSDDAGALNVLRRAHATGEHLFVATPDRGNVHGLVGYVAGGSRYGFRGGTYTISGIPVWGFRGPYRNGCYVFTSEAP